MSPADPPAAPPPSAAPSTAAAAGEAPRPLEKREVRLVIIGALLGLFLAALDQTIVATALPAIAADLGNLDLIGWVVTAYLLTSTTATPVLGKLSDIVGRRLVVHLCLALFLLGSVLCALAPSMLLLVIFRALQGIGGGGLIVMAQTVIADVVSPRERGRYAGMISATWAIAAVLGPTLGGFLTQFVSWHLIFWINLPLGLAAFLVIDRQLRRLTVARRPARIDAAGIFVFACGTTSLLLALSWAGEPGGLLAPTTLAAAGAALALGLLFALQQRQSPAPIIPPHFFANPVVGPLLLAIFLIFGSYLAATILAPTYLQVALQAPAGEAGLLMIPMMLATTVSAWRAGLHASRSGRYKGPPTASLPIAIAALLALGLFAGDLGPVGASALFLLVGFGIGPIFPVTIIAAQNAVQRHELGAVSGSVAFSRALGGAVATAAGTALVLGLLARWLPGLGEVANLEDLVRRQLAPAERAEVAAAFSVLFFATAATLALGLYLFIRVEARPLGEEAPAVRPPANGDR